MGLTAHLQHYALPQSSSVTAVNQLNVPPLYCMAPWQGRHFPARGRGVLIGPSRGTSQQDAGPLAALGRQLEPPGPKARQPLHLAHRCPHAAAAQAFLQSPQQIGRSLGSKNQQVIQVNTQPRQSRRKQSALRIAPRHHPRMTKRPRQNGRKGQWPGLIVWPENFVDSAVAEFSLRQQFIQRRQARGRPRRRPTARTCRPLSQLSFAGGNESHNTSKVRIKLGYRQSSAAVNAKLSRNAILV